ncbi:MAG TPA: replication initiation protein [Citreicella sp.]|jgi:replication initiation protein RepC|nr:replication initiation protein [Citreicella sp.]
MQTYISTPQRRRPETAVQSPENKWRILRDLTTARKSFGLSDRALTVLSALLSFHRSDNLTAETVVFPSNRVLGDRANGMPESTLRRHLSSLVEARLITRRDSPNRKRYARHTESGLMPFGFDLSPLLRQRDVIAAEADRILKEDARRKVLRETVMVTLQALAAHPAYASDCADLNAIRQRLRRKLDIDALATLLAGLRAALATLTPAAPAESQDLSGNDSQNERHIQDSDKTLIESEPETTAPRSSQPSLIMVTALCTELAVYDPSPIRRWDDFIEKAARIAPMMGISVDTWRQACATMTASGASITVAAMLQKFSRIRNPGGYLRSLARKAAGNGFSPMPMLHALARGAS